MKIALNGIKAGCKALMGLSHFTEELNSKLKATRTIYQ